jgi:hypothetical protein
MALRLSASSVGRLLPPERFLVRISVISCVDPRAIVQLEGLGKLENQNTSKMESTFFVCVCESYHVEFRLNLTV